MPEPIKKNFVLITLFLIVLAGLPVTIFVFQQQQNIRGRAASSPTPTVCANVTTDTILIIDRSGSMNDKVGSSGTKISNAKTAAKNFVDIMAQNPQNHVGLVSFASSASLDSSLTTNYSSVKSKIDAISANNDTCAQCGIDKANQEIATNGRPGVKKVVVFLTDGIANFIEGGTKQIDAATAEKAALTAVASGNTANGTVFYTIGLGNTVNTKFLTQLATSTGASFFFPPTTDDLNQIYQQISLILSKGSVAGTVFNDANNNGVLDTGEVSLSGWTIQLLAQGATTAETFTTDTNGAFSIPNLCNGTYILKEVPQSGWKQTLPASPDGYTITISGGSGAANKNFGNFFAPVPTPTPTPKPRCADGIDNDTNGYTDTNDSSCHTDGNPKNPGSYDPNKDGEHGGGNTCADSKDNNNNGLIDGGDPVCHTDGNPSNPGSYDPNLSEVSPTATPAPTVIPTTIPTATLMPTPIPTPGLTTISMEIFEHGIGNSGDNTNPNQFSLSNKTPIHPQIPADIQIYNSVNQLVASGAGTVTYDTTTGSYKSGLICSGGNSFQTGSYTVKVKTDKHLRRQLPGIQNIVVGQNNELPSISLVAGDANNDNSLNILDYNELIGCYSDLAAATSCTPDQKLATDLNDDGFVNQFDYNLFLREIATQPGQ